MDRQLIGLGEQNFLLINVPLILISLTTNIFYASCLIFCKTQRLKQPLKMLLVVLVWCSITYCVSMALLFCVLHIENHVEVVIVVWGFVDCYMRNSMACSVLLNFYYYIQIVPLQRAFLIWVKRNIKILMYMVLLFDGIIFLFYSVISTADTFIHTITHVNGTLSEYWNDGLLQAINVCFIIVEVHTLLYLCIILVSSFSTALYLHRHIKTVTQGNIYSATIQMKSQIRVTITGIIQGVLFLLFATFTFLYSFTRKLSPHFYFSTGIHLTVSTIYISGTTVNLGIGQAIFRQKVADTWKAITSMCGVGMNTSDVKSHSSQLTSVEIATITVDVRM